jgi:catechol 2,3-dioxygenase-like lactoylglutathione lyase family enzyme
MKLSGITRAVDSLEKSRQFYENLLGFVPGPSYEPTRWQSYICQEGVYFAVGETQGSTNEISFVVEDLEELWERVKDQVEVISPLEKTPWGTYRFVIRDPDGNLLAFAAGI